MTFPKVDTKSGFFPPPKFRPGDRVLVTCEKPAWLGKVVSECHERGAYLYVIEACLPGHPRTVSEWESCMTLVSPDEVPWVILEIASRG